MLKTDKKVEDVIVKVVSEEGNYALMFYPDITRLDLLVEDPRRLGWRRLGELIDFCDRLTGRQSFCSYRLRQRKAKVYTWFVDQAYIKSFLEMMVNSDGFVPGGYEDLTLSDGYRLEDYRNDTMRRDLVQQKMAMAQA